MFRMRGKTKRRSHWLWALGVVLTVVLIGSYVFIEPYWLVETNYLITDDSIPAEFDGYEILFVADIHHGPFFSFERVEKLRDRMNSMDADVILLGGDYVHRGPLYVPEVFRGLTGLTAPDGVMGVLGNHDHWDGEQATRDGFEAAGITDIENRTITIQRGDSTINLTGVGDLDMGYQNLEVSPDIYTICISHNPDFVTMIEEQKPSLMLSGHTHGGQVTLFGLWAPFIPSEYGNRFRYGTMEYNGVRMIVTSGVGTITPPVRFFAWPEIVRITLRSGNGS